MHDKEIIQHTYGHHMVDVHNDIHQHSGVGLHRSNKSTIRIGKMKIISIVALAVGLSGCAVTGKDPIYSRKDPNRGNVTQSQITRDAGAKPNAPVMLRIIKESNELELWKQNKDDSWSKVKTYEICHYSGVLGPKKRQGDYQAPEGFYSITASQLNAHSSEHLSLNTGYPNLRDRLNHYSGAALMIHGGCSSAGCYAITDGNIEEVFAAVRDAIRGGQKSVQLQIYPFYMNNFRMFLSKDDPNIEFWRELKQGWEWFNENKKPIPVDVKNRKYYINK